MARANGGEAARRGRHRGLGPMEPHGHGNDVIFCKAVGRVFCEF